MTESETRALPSESHPSRVTRGCVYLTQEEASLLRLRSKQLRKNISTTIQELVEPTVDRFEDASEEVRNIMLNGYTDQSQRNLELGLKIFKSSKSPAFVEVYWVLPRAFMERLNIIAGQRNMEGFLLMSHILSDAISIRNDSK